MNINKQTNQKYNFNLGLDLKILMWLVKNQNFNQEGKMPPRKTDIHRKLGYSTTSTDKNLTKLEEGGFVRSEKQGRNKFLFVTKTGASFGHGLNTLDKLFCEKKNEF